MARWICTRTCCPQSVLPLLEAEAKKEKDVAQSYALLYDRTQLALGGNRRYRSQLWPTPTGEVRLPRLEDPKAADGRRAELGLEPLTDYPARFGPADSIAIEAAE